MDLEHEKKNQFLQKYLTSKVLWKFSMGLRRIFNVFKKGFSTSELYNALILMSIRCVEQKLFEIFRFFWKKPFSSPFDSDFSRWKSSGNEHIERHDPKITLTASWRYNQNYSFNFELKLIWFRRKKTRL